MQKHTAKIITLILITSLFSLSLSAKPAVAKIKQADSLFAAKRYTQALSHYEQMLTDKEYTPAMLLKMGYIYEAMGNIAKTQYFLSLYFLSTNDDAALEKMEQLATKNNLEGYALTDTDQIALAAKRIATPSIWVSIGLILIFLAWVIQQHNSNKRPVTPFVLGALSCLALVVFVQLAKGKNTSIILQPTTYLMSGPSAGADVVEIVAQGHKVEVLGKKDVWLKIRWREQDAYLKEGQLQSVEL